MSTVRVPRVALAAATVFLLTAASAPNTAVAQAGTGPKCFDKAATIVGDRGVPRLVGTAGPDVIFSRWTGQEVHGLAGDDLLCGRNSIFGGRGDDRISERGAGGNRGPEGGSAIFGGPGDDTTFRDHPFDGFADIHYLTSGGPGRDRLHGGPNVELLRGGPGGDRILGMARHDELIGGRGPDFLVGGGGGDNLRGEAGADRLTAEDGNDHLLGGPGNDLARGGRGRDEISGGDGVDVAFGGLDVDRCEAEEAHCELP